MDNKITELFNRIMKQDVKAILEIETLEDAQEIIARMAMFNGVFNVMKLVEEDFLRG